MNENDKTKDEARELIKKSLADKGCIVTKVDSYNGIAFFDYSNKPELADMLNLFEDLKLLHDSICCAIFKFNNSQNIGYFGAELAAKELYKNFSGVDDKSMWVSMNTRISEQFLYQEVLRMYNDIYEKVRDTYLILPKHFQDMLKSYT